MQQQLEQVQAALAARTVDATSGGGAVKVTAKCDGTLASIEQEWLSDTVNVPVLE